MTTTADKPLRVLVVEDSLTIRHFLIEQIEADPRFEVVGQASEGRHGAELCRLLRPDVVSIDMVLEGESGLDATRRIMAEAPTPILIVSSSHNRGADFHTLDALNAGALDVLDKPGADDFDGRWGARYRSLLRTVSGVRVITRRSLRPDTAVAPAVVPVGPAPRLLALGASTGGPAALASVLPQLPPRFPLPVLVVVHIDPVFDQSLCDWLTRISPLPVRLARDGESLAGAAGQVLIAPGGLHLVLDQLQLRLRDLPERHSCKPSVDTLFESLARSLGARCAAALLTGMGVDGADGLLALRRAGALTIAQDEASSAIYGMPRAAVERGAAELVLPLARIIPAMVDRATAMGAVR